jgi:hypothetical protein
MYVSFIDRALSALEEILNSPDIISPALAGTASDEQGGAAYNTSGGVGLSSSSSARATKRQRGDNDDERSFSSATVSGVTDDAASALSSMMTGNVFHLRLPPPCDHRDGNYHLKKAIILQALFDGCSSVKREARITSIDGGLDRENDHSNSTSKDSKKKKGGTTNGRATPAAAVAANETRGASSNPTGLIEARLRIFKDYLHMRHGLSSVDTTCSSVLASSMGVPTTTAVLAAGGSWSRVKNVGQSHSPSSDSNNHQEWIGTSSTSSVEEMKIVVDGERRTSSSAGGAASVPCGDCKKKEPTEQVEQELSNDLLAVSTPECIDFCERLLQVCTGDVRHVTPLPSYRDSGGKNLSINHISQRYAEYECHGLLAIIEDSFKIKAFSESVSAKGLSISCSTPISWKYNCLVFLVLGSSSRSLRNLT